MSWTDERVDLLKKMWSEGQSASQIAKELGGVTRNAVIGKVHRLGLSNRTGVGPAPAAADASAAIEPAAAAPAASDTTTSRARSEATAPSAPEPLQSATKIKTEEADIPPMTPARKAIIPAGQPLPPQPSANEISPEALAKVSEVEKSARRISLMELTERTGKWPVGDPATPDFWFCGLPVQQGKPYCDAHVGVAFQPMSSRRDRRR